MKNVPIVVAVVVLLLLAVVLRNGTSIAQTAPVDLYFMTVDLSLGLVLAVVLFLVTVAYLATIGRVRMQAAVESRDLHRELDRARRTADTAEASRIAELKGYLERELPALDLKLDQALERMRVPAPIAPRPAPPL